MSDNKVKYGLKNVHYAVATIAADGSATYGEVKPWPGGVSLSLDAQGGTTKFRADNINYWIGQSNNGYEGDLESALIPDSYRLDVLGETIDANGVRVENVEAQTVAFALLFQFEGDAKATRHVLYNCTATRPSVSGSTTDEEIEPQTETITITAGSAYFANYDGGKNLSKGSAAVGDAAYAGWFGSVYVPSGSSNVVTVTQTLTHCTSSWSAPTIQTGGTFVTFLEADSTYTMGTVTVTMGGESVAGAYNEDNGCISIANVTGAIVVTATAS